jgi:ribosome-binding protein aMBF1 (putative translation factor)
LSRGLVGKQGFKLTALGAAFTSSHLCIVNTKDFFWRQTYACDDMYPDLDTIPLAELNINGHPQGHDSGAMSVPLCEQCKQFDIQSFGKAPDGRKGYALSSIQKGARDGCEFCGLLYDCVEELPDGEWKEVKKPYIHLSLWEDYTIRIKKGRSTDGLSANRLAIWVGGRYTVKPRESEVAVSSAEICLAADIGKLCYDIPLLPLISNRESGSFEQRYHRSLFG